jgi:hypothetical protein
LKTDITEVRQEDTGETVGTLRGRSESEHCATIHTLKRTTKMLRTEMVDLIKDGETEPRECPRGIGTRAECLNHCDDAVHTLNLAFFALNTTNANTRT